MPPHSRGSQLKPPPIPNGFQSKSTPNLPTLRSLKAAGSHTRGNSHADPSHPSQPHTDSITSPSEPSFSLSNPSDDSASTSGFDEESEHVSKLPTRPIYNHHSRSHTYLGPSAFAPPFYNRPPTPLPPSPSLTSLLRPNFNSLHNSRPTTPDPSSDEANSHVRDGTQTPVSALASTLRTAKTVPRASPKVPTYEYYGFTLYLTSSLAFMIYILWAFLPSAFLHQLGIFYFPDRWWALAIPAWVVMAVVYLYIALAAYNTGHLTIGMQNVECLVDEAASVAVLNNKGEIIRNDKPSWGARAGSPERGTGRQGRQQRPGLGLKGINGGHSRQSSRQSSLSRVHQVVEKELDWKTLWMEGTDAVMDIPVGGVCEILYGGDDDDDFDDDNDANVVYA